MHISFRCWKEALLLVIEVSLRVMQTDYTYNMTLACKCENQRTDAWITMIIQRVLTMTKSLLDKVNDEKLFATENEIVNLFQLNS